MSGWNNPIFIRLCIVQPLKSGINTIASAKHIMTAVVRLDKLNSFFFVSGSAGFVSGSAGLDA